MIEWRAIPNYEPYEISNCGLLRRNGVILTTPIGNVGYKRKYLKDLKKNLNIHRALAICFIENPMGLKEVNHKNGIKSDNSLDNLEWVSRKGNAEHAAKNGLLKTKFGQDSPKAKLTWLQVSVIREALSFGYSQTSIAKYFHLHQSTISLIKSNINWVC